jgi:hypothetical protein
MPPGITVASRLPIEGNIIPSATEEYEKAAN